MRWCYRLGAKMSINTGLLTVGDYLKLPEPREGHLELHHGEVVTVPPPKWRHQILQDRISTLLRTGIGESGIALCEMAFRPAPEYEVWQADVGYARRDRASTIHDDEYLNGAPDLVVEVISPGNTADEIDDKWTICTEHGCLSFWVVNDRRKLVSVTEGNVTKHYTQSSSIVCSLLPGEIPVDDILA
jgi:Uma2 family endonuclease